MLRPLSPLPSPGGIGPTPDDITYQSIAKAFDAEPLAYHDETLRRMQENLAARRRDQGEVTEDVSGQSDLGVGKATESEHFWLGALVDDDGTQAHGSLSQQGRRGPLYSLGALGPRRENEGKALHPAGYP